MSDEKRTVGELEDFAIQALKRLREEGVGVHMSLLVLHIALEKLERAYLRDASEECVSEYRTNVKKARRCAVGAS